MSRFFGLLALAALLCMSAVSGQTCGGAGYDLSSLQGQQFYYFDGSYHFTVSPCGVVNNATACPNPNYPNTAFCQARPGFNGTSLAQYTAANSTWGQTLNANGVVQELRDGTFCGAEGGADGGGPREASIVYQCVPSATTPYLINVTEVHTCFYTAYVATAAACTRQANAATGPNSAYGTRYYDGRCGGGAYDLSALQQVDMFWSPAPQFSNQTVWFLRVCGAVSAANCTATSNQGGAGVPTETAMLCQSDQTNPTGNDHAAAFYVPGLQQWTVPSAAGGLRMEIQDGQACGNWNRQTTIEFSCDSTATTPVLVDVIEHITCYYTARVRTNLVCPQYFLAGSTGAAQPSQSSSAIPSVSSGVNPTSSSTGQPAPGNGGGNGAASTTVSAVVVAAVVAVAALML